MLFIRKIFYIFSQFWLIPHTSTSQTKYANSSNKQTKCLYGYLQNICTTSKLPFQAHFLPTLNPVLREKHSASLDLYFFPETLKSHNKMHIFYHHQILDNICLFSTRNLYPSLKFISLIFGPKLAFLVSLTSDIIFWLSSSKYFLLSFSSPFLSVSQFLPSGGNFLLC